MNGGDNSRREISVPADIPATNVASGHRTTERGNRAGALASRWRGPKVRGRRGDEPVGTIQGLQDHGHYGLPADGRAYRHQHACERPECPGILTHVHKRRPLEESLRLEPVHICYECRKNDKRGTDPATPQRSVSADQGTSTGEQGVRSTERHCSEDKASATDGIDNALLDDALKLFGANPLGMTDVNLARVGGVVNSRTIDYVFTNRELYHYLATQVFLVARTPDVGRTLMRKATQWLEEHGFKNAEQIYIMASSAVAATMVETPAEGGLRGFLNGHGNYDSMHSATELARGGVRANRPFYYDIAPYVANVVSVGTTVGMGWKWGIKGLLWGSLAGSLANIAGAVVYNSKPPVRPMPRKE